MFAEGSVDREQLAIVGDEGKLESLLPSLTVRYGRREDWGRRAYWGEPSGTGRGVEERRVWDERIRFAGQHFGASYLEHLAFAAALRDGTPAVIPVEEGVRAVATGIAAHRSIDERRRVELGGDIVDEGFERIAIARGVDAFGEEWELDASAAAQPCERAVERAPPREIGRRPIDDERGGDLTRADRRSDDVGIGPFDRASEIARDRPAIDELRFGEQRFDTGHRLREERRATRGRTADLGDALEQIGGRPGGIEMTERVVEGFDRARSRGAVLRELAQIEAEKGLTDREA